MRLHLGDGKSGFAYEEISGKFICQPVTEKMWNRTKIVINSFATACTENDTRGVRALL